MIKRRKTVPWVISTFVCLVLVCLLTSYTSLAQPAAQNANKKEGGAAEKSRKEQTLPAGPVDEYDRGTPRSSVKGFFKAARGGDYERAAQYLDLRNLPRWIDKNEGPELARQLKIALDRTLWVDLEQVSADPKGNIEDGLPTQRESIGGIKTPEKTVDILLQRVPREDGVLIWKFSNRTVAEIPQLYKYLGYGPFQETLSKVFPDVALFGWQLWQWALFLVALPFTYLAALLPTWIAGRLVRRRDEPQICTVDYRSHSDCLVGHVYQGCRQVSGYGRSWRLSVPRQNPVGLSPYLGCNPTCRPSLRLVGRTSAKER
jgi:MscS family membrane protein